MQIASCVVQGAWVPFTVSTTYSTTMGFSSSDRAVEFHHVGTFGPFGPGTHEFDGGPDGGGVRFNTLGTQTLTVTDVNNPTIRDTATVTVATSC